MNGVTILGGGGYLGSVITQSLMQSGKVKDIIVVDCDMWGDMPQFAASIVLKRDNLLKLGPSGISKGHKVVWSIDIDSENFYTYPFSAKYIKDNLKVFAEFAKKFGMDLILVTDDYFGDNEDYKKFIARKIEICEENSCSWIKVPQLFGPSSRMRYDTLLNDMFYNAFTAGVIHLDDWLRRCSVCSVAVAGEYIAENVVLGQAKNVTIRNCTLSLCDYAGIMTRIFDGKIRMMLTDGMTSYEYLEIEDIAVVPFGRYTIKKSFEYMSSSLEKDGIADMIRDCHNNSKMLYSVKAYANLIHSLDEYLG